MPVRSRSRWSGSSCTSWPWRATTRAVSRCGRRRSRSRGSSTPRGSPWPARRPPRGSGFGRRSARGLRFETDPEKFALIVQNLLSNAVAYSPPDTMVICASEATAERRHRAASANQVENLEPSDLPLMFDRFWRKDEARAGGRNAGLGLALVRAMADLLDIGSRRGLHPDRTFRVTLLAVPSTGLTRGQKRNCTSARTTQAPPFAPGRPRRAGSSPATTLSSRWS